MPACLFLVDFVTVIFHTSEQCPEMILRQEHKLNTPHEPQKLVQTTSSKPDGI